MWIAGAWERMLVDDRTARCEVDEFDMVSPETVFEDIAAVKLADELEGRDLGGQERGCDA